MHLLQDEHGHWDVCEAWSGSEGNTIRAQDQAFCMALAHAVEAGTEQVPMIGMDTRPGTAHPQMLGAATAPSWGGWLAT